MRELVCLFYFAQLCLLSVGNVGWGSMVVDLDETDVLDLTYPFDNRTIYYPREEQLGFTFQLGSVYQGDKKGQYQAAYWFQAGEHGGTHVDSPSHTQRNGISVDHIPVTQLMGPAVVIDVSAKVLHNPDYQVTSEDLQAWEEQYGTMANRCILFIFTGWASRKWPNRNMIFGTQNFPEDTEYHFPGLHPDGAEWIVKNRQVKAVAIDGPSLDSGENQRYLPVHHIISKAQIVVIEFVANLDKMPATGSIVFGLPMKITGGTGAPLRLVAFGWRNGQTMSVNTQTYPSTSGSIRVDADRQTRRKNSSKSSATSTTMTRATAASAAGLAATRKPKDHSRKPKIANSAVKLTPVILLLVFQTIICDLIVG